MIWLFKSNEVFWGDKPKVDEYFLFDSSDINFDITKYHISLYFGLAKYFLLDDSNDDEIYFLTPTSPASNPERIKMPKSSDYIEAIKSFYNTERRERKINELGI